MDAKTLLFVGLGAMLVIYSVTVFRGGLVMPTALQSAIGFVTAFFDTLGIGSFATTTAVYKLRNMVPVKLIPGTLNVGHALSTIAQAFIYTKLVPVDPTTLILMIAAASAGAWVGVGVVVHWPRRKIQIGMGIALLGAAALMLMTQLNIVPGGGDAHRADRDAARDRSGRQLRPRRADDARHRPLRAVHDSGQPARHGADRGVSDHDGIVRVPDADQQRAVRADAHLRRARRARPRARRPAGGADRGLVVQSMSLDAVRWLVVVVVIYTSLNMLMTAQDRQGRRAGRQDGRKACVSRSS